MHVEIHTRPLILSKLAGTSDQDNAHEVDVWLYMGDRYNCGQVILETVVPNKEAANEMIGDLQAAFKTAVVLLNDKA